MSAIRSSAASAVCGTPTSRSGSTSQSPDSYGHRRSRSLHGRHRDGAPVQPSDLNVGWIWSARFRRIRITSGQWPALNLWWTRPDISTGGTVPVTISDACDLPPGIFTRRRVSAERRRESDRCDRLRHVLDFHRAFRDSVSIRRGRLLVASAYRDASTERRFRVRRRSEHSRSAVVAIPAAVAVA